MLRLLQTTKRLQLNQRFCTNTRRIERIRNVGIFAHVDAGKTTVTEKFLALSGFIHTPGSVDDGTTITDYLAAERERGITIQSAAVSFEWIWANSEKKDDTILVNLIDTPGHVDFSVEVNRTAAVLDAGVLVLDAVAGVQAQTETVWRTMTNNSKLKTKNSLHESLPCLILVNKMDRDGSDFQYAIQTVRQKLMDSNPVSIQMPLYKNTMTQNMSVKDGEFVGVVDLVHMRQILYNEKGNPCITKLDINGENDTIIKAAKEKREELIEYLADVDEDIGEMFLMEENPSNRQVREALRRATLTRRIMPVLAGTALKGKGIEPLLDCVADYLPSPLDRLPPNVISASEVSGTNIPKNAEGGGNKESIPFGHPLHNELLAYAFKVVHMKGKGSGDGRVVFCRVYSGTLPARATLQVTSPDANGAPTEVRKERVASLLEISGGRFDNLEDGICESGEVCALVGLKSVKTGDTLVAMKSGSSNSSQDKTMKNKSQQSNKKKKLPICLAGLTTPSPVLTVRLETYSSEEDKKLSEALSLLAVEDPSLKVKETDSYTELSGLGELHIDVMVDRIRRDFGIDVEVGPPSVAYNEFLISRIETAGMVEFERTVGTNTLQASIHLSLEPLGSSGSTTGIYNLKDNIIELGSEAREFLGIYENDSLEDICEAKPLVKSLIDGLLGSLKRGILGPYPIINTRCTVINVSAKNGLGYLQDNPGALRAASSNVISTLLSSNQSQCSVLEPVMKMEIFTPSDYVGSILSDINNRRGTIGEVVVGNEDGHHVVNSKALIKCNVPLVEILGYATSLRSLTGGEGTFSAEYAGHGECDFVPTDRLQQQYSF